MVSHSAFGIRSPDWTVLALADRGRVYVSYTDRLARVRASVCRLAACLAFAGWADGRSVSGVLKQLSDDQFREFVTQLTIS